MRGAGCEGIFDMTTGAAMLTGILGSAGKAFEAWGRTTDLFSHRKIDAAVVIDSPMLNLPIALRSKSRAIPTLYYIAPQLWAWGAYRVHKVRARIDKLAVVLPFEEAYFRNWGLDATYVGHPLFDVLSARRADADAVSEIRSAGEPVIAILPGSRTHVVSEVLPGQLAVARGIRDRYGRCHVGVSVAGDAVAGRIDTAISRSGVSASVYRGQNAELLSAADLTLVASGTATLEVAHYGSPMIVMYNGSKLMYQLLGRWMITLDHFSLVNILAGRRAVPEFMPYYDSPVPIIESALDLLASPSRLQRMRDDLSEIIAPIREPGASDRTAALLLDMIDTH
jgi:lipid-A-disaccharide synthase